MLSCDLQLVSRSTIKTIFVPKVVSHCIVECYIILTGFTKEPIGEYSSLLKTIIEDYFDESGEKRHPDVASSDSARGEERQMIIFQAGVSQMFGVGFILTPDTLIAICLFFPLGFGCFLIRRPEAGKQVCDAGRPI